KGGHRYECPPSPFVLSAVAFVILISPGVLRVAKTRFNTRREPPAGKSAEGGSDPDQKQRIRARIRYGGGQLSEEPRVAERTERDRRRVDDSPRPIRVDAARIAHERASHLIDWSGSARGVPSDQHEAVDAELNRTAYEIEARKPRSGNPGTRAAMNLTYHVPALVEYHCDRVVDARSRDDADN